MKNGELTKIRKIQNWSNMTITLWCVTMVSSFKLMTPILNLHVRANPCVSCAGANRGVREEPTDASSSTQKGFNSTRRIEPFWVREG